MARYWKLLANVAREDDSYNCVSVLSESSESQRSENKIRRLLTRKLIYPARIKFRCHGDVVHVLDHSWSDMLLFVPKNALKVVTVHDLIPLRYPGELSKSQSARFRSWVGCLHLADAIIAVSQYTKDETSELLGIEEKKIHVVPNGVNLPDPSPKTRMDLRNIDDQSFRIGSIGSTLMRKNLDIFPKTLAKLKENTQRQIVLVRAGAALSEGLAANIRHVIGSENLIEMGKLPDDELDHFYASLDVLTVPSFYEGFGLPVLEGMAARVPVLASNTSSLPEVGADLAFYFDPTSPEDFARSLTRILHEGVPVGHINSAYERARSFSWRNSLEGVYRVYDELRAIQAAKTT